MKSEWLTREGRASALFWLLLIIIVFLFQIATYEFLITTLVGGGVKGKAVNSECHRQTGKHLKEIHITTVVMEGKASLATEQLGAKVVAWDGRGDGACTPHHHGGFARKTTLSLDSFSHLYKI